MLFVCLFIHLLLFLSLVPFYFITRGLDVILEILDSIHELDSNRFKKEHYFFISVSLSKIFFLLVGRPIPHHERTRPLVPPRYFLGQSQI